MESCDEKKAAGKDRLCPVPEIILKEPWARDISEFTGMQSEPHHNHPRRPLHVMP